jgi:hypothetical protein
LSRGKVLSGLPKLAAFSCRPEFLFWFFGAAISHPSRYCKDFPRRRGPITLFLACSPVGVALAPSWRALSARLRKGSFRRVFGDFVVFLDVSGWASDALVASSAGHVTILELLASAGGVAHCHRSLAAGHLWRIFIVPLYTLIQQRSQEMERSRIIAATTSLMLCSWLLPRSC